MASWFCFTMERFQITRLDQCFDGFLSILELRSWILPLLPVGVIVRTNERDDTYVSGAELAIGSSGNVILFALV